MLVVYEKIDDFIKKIKTLNTIDTTMFVSPIKNINEAGLITPSIIVQAQIKETIYMIRYTEEMPTFQIIAPGVFGSITDETLRNTLTKNYQESYDAFEKKIEDTNQKMIDLVKSHQFLKIENAFIQ